MTINHNVLMSNFLKPISNKPFIYTALTTFSDQINNAKKALLMKEATHRFFLFEDNLMIVKESILAYFINDEEREDVSEYQSFFIINS